MRRAVTPLRAVAALARIVALCLCLGALAPAVAPPVWAVTPSEQLKESALEARARDLSQLLRCPQCQSENIDESNAPIAQDLRRLVRERLLAGDTDSAVLDYVTARYGEFVLFRPEAQGINLILWTAGPALLLLALALALLAARQRAGAEAPPDLTAEEEARLRELTGRE